MKKSKLISIFITIFILVFNISISYAESNTTAMTQMSFTVPQYLHIQPVTSPVLIANITDQTGNLYHPLSTIFKVISNSGEARNLYLSAVINTDGGRESAMFEQGGRVYVAFGNLQSPPTLNSLVRCKHGGVAPESPGVVAYPVLSILGVKPHYIRGKEKYEMSVKSGTTYITVNIGQNVLRNSFSSNDPRGAYQSILMLTESDM